MDKRIKRAKFAAKLLDSQFSIAGVRFGIDPIINLVPWLGTVMGALLSLYILRIGYDIGLSKKDLLTMVGNIGLDFIVGAVPYLGIIFDVIYKANIRNIKILEKYSHGKFVEGEIVS